MKSIMRRQANLTESNRTVSDISELSEQRMKELTSAPEVHEVKYTREKGLSNQQRQHGSECGRSQQLTKSRNEEHRQKLCPYCGSVHKQRNCPAYGKKCCVCGKLNHFERVCRSNTPQVTKNRRSVNIVTEEKQGIQPFLIDMLGAYNVQAVTQDALSITVEVRSKPLKLKVDTGVRCNVLPKYILDSLNICNKIDYTKRVKLISYSRSNIPFL